MYNKSDKYVKDWLPFNLSCDEVSNCEIEDLSHLKIEDTNTDYSSFSSKKEYQLDNKASQIACSAYYSMEKLLYNEPVDSMCFSQTLKTEKDDLNNNFLFIRLVGSSINQTTNAASNCDTFLQQKSNSNFDKISKTESPFKNENFKNTLYETEIESENIKHSLQDKILIFLYKYLCLEIKQYVIIKTKKYSTNFQSTDLKRQLCDSLSKQNERNEYYNLPISPTEKIDRIRTVNPPNSIVDKKFLNNDLTNVLNVSMKILQNRHNINIYPDNNFQHFMHKSYIPVKLVELDNIRDVRNETLVCSTKFKKKLKFINQEPFQKNVKLSDDIEKKLSVMVFGTSLLTINGIQKNRKICSANLAKYSKLSINTKPEYIKKHINAICSIKDNIELPKINDDCNKPYLKIPIMSSNPPITPDISLGRYNSQYVGDILKNKRCASSSICRRSPGVQYADMNNNTNSKIHVNLINNLNLKYDENLKKNKKIDESHFKYTRKKICENDINNQRIDSEAIKPLNVNNLFFNQNNSRPKSTNGLYRNNRFYCKKIYTNDVNTVPLMCTLNIIGNRLKRTSDT